jgi:hypothetical protein
VIVLAREEERRPFAGEILFQGGRLAIELCGQLRISRLLDKLEIREEVVDAGLEAPPQLDLGAEAARLAEDFLGAALVIPEAGFGRQRLELRGARFLRPEVKDAPRSTGSAPPGLE